MYFVGENIKFKRTNNSWVQGVVLEIDSSPYITVQWVHSNQLIGTKKVHRLYVKRNDNLLKNCFNKYLFVVISVIIGAIIQVDSYFYLKKVKPFSY